MSATAVVEIDRAQVSQVARQLSDEQRERRYRALFDNKDTILVQAVTARVAVPGQAAWPGGPVRPTFETDPDHSTVELPALDRFAVRVVRTGVLIEEEVRRFWMESGKRPTAVCLNPLRLLTIVSSHWRRYPVRLIGSVIVVALVALPTLGDDEVCAATGLIDSICDSHGINT